MDNAIFFWATFLLICSAVYFGAIGERSVQDLSAGSTLKPRIGNKGLDNCVEGPTSSALACSGDAPPGRPDRSYAPPLGSGSSFALVSPATILSLFASIASLVGFAITTVLSLPKEKREAARAAVDLEKAQLENERLAQPRACGEKARDRPTCQAAFVANTE